VDAQRLAARWREASEVVGGRGAAAARDGELELALSTLPTSRAARAKTPQQTEAAYAGTEVALDGSSV
jgi:hypothetical protein